MVDLILDQNALEHVDTGAVRRSGWQVASLEADGAEEVRRLPRELALVVLAERQVVLEDDALAVRQVLGNLELQLEEELASPAGLGLSLLDAEGVLAEFERLAASSGVLQVVVAEAVFVLALWWSPSPLGCSSTGVVVMEVVNLRRSSGRRR